MTQDQKSLPLQPSSLLGLAPISQHKTQQLQLRLQARCRPTKLNSSYLLHGDHSDDYSLNSMTSFIFNKKIRCRRCCHPRLKNYDALFISKLFLSFPNNIATSICSSFPSSGIFLLITAMPFLRLLPRTTWEEFSRFLQTPNFNSF